MWQFSLKIIIYKKYLDMFILIKLKLLLQFYVICSRLDSIAFNF